MKSISVQWTDGITMPEAKVVIEGVARAVEATLSIAARAGIGLEKPEIRPFGTWYIPHLERGSPYWSTMWYVSQSLDEATQRITGPRFFDTIRNEPWQRIAAHYDVAILHHDLVDDPEAMGSDQGREYALSSTERNLAAVISVNRLRNLSDDETFRMALIRLTVHSFGHILEAPAHDRSTSTTRSFGDIHCTNECVMRHTAAVGELVEAARSEREARIQFCEECQTDILAHAIRHHFSLS